MGSFLAFASVFAQTPRAPFQSASMLRTFTRSLVFGASGQLFALYSKLPLLSLAFFAGAGDRALSQRRTGSPTSRSSGARASTFGHSSRRSSSTIIRRQTIRRGVQFPAKFDAARRRLAAATLFALAEPVITLLMGEQYRDAARLSPLAFTHGRALIYHLCSRRGYDRFQPERRPKFFSRFSTTLIGALTALLLIPRFGAMGAVFTDLAIMSVASCTARPVRFSKRPCQERRFRQSGIPRLPEWSSPPRQAIILNTAIRGLLRYGTAASRQSSGSGRCDPGSRSSAASN
jgi:hypothetical protein